MPQNLAYLFAAFAVTWVGIFAFIFYMQKKLAEATTRMSDLERTLNDRDEG